jgi:hypothetical protein
MKVNVDVDWFDNEDVYLIRPGSLRFDDANAVEVPDELIFRYDATRKEVIEIEKIFWNIYNDQLRKEAKAQDKIAATIRQQKRHQHKQKRKKVSDAVTLLASQFEIEGDSAIVAYLETAKDSGVFGVYDEAREVVDRFRQNQIVLQVRLDSEALAKREARKVKRDASIS